MTVYPWLQEPIACSACKMEFRAVETEYPCRVCDSVFHKDCVLEMKDIHPSHIEAVEKANTSVGWSCPVCVRINLNVYTMFRKHYQICCITRFLRGTFLQYHLRHQKMQSVKIFHIGHSSEKLPNMYTCFGIKT